MLLPKLSVLALVLVMTKLLAQEPQLSQQDKNVLALLEWGGSTASAIYGVVKADNERRVPGDRYEQLAQNIAFEIAAGRASSRLVSAPMDLTSSLLYGAALVDPEPLSRTVALIGGYASKKFGETMSEAIINQANAQADAVLKRGLENSNITVDSLEMMSPQQFTETIENLLIGDKKLAEILKDSPQSLARIQGHASDLRDTAQLATLKTVQGVKGAVDEIADGVNFATQQLESLSDRLNIRLEGIETNLVNIKDALVEQAKNLDSLQQSVGGNSAAIQAIAQVSSMTWSTDQKLAALDAGLFPDLNDVQRDSMRAALNAQKNTEKLVSDLNKATSIFNDLSIIASNLGVDPKIVQVAQTGQLITGAIASYAQGNYLGAAVGVSALLGMGSGGGDQNAAMMSYMKAEFEKINRKLDVIIDLQKQTLKAVVVVSKQLERMQMQMQVIERDVAISLISLQYLQLAPWQACEALTNLLKSDTPSLAQFKEIASQPELNSYLSTCYGQYAQWFDANIAAGKWGYDILDLKVFPNSGVYKNQSEINYYGRLVDSTQKSYDATRLYFLKVHGALAGTEPAMYLASFLDPQSTVAEADAREVRRETAAAQLKGFRCGQTGLIHNGIAKPLCLNVQNGEPPEEGVWQQLLYPQLAGPFAPRLIDVGIAVSLWSTFSYIDKNRNIVVYVPANDIAGLGSAGLTNKLKLAKAANRRGAMLTRLEWLAEGYLLQQSMMYGDFIAQLVVNELYDPKTKALIAPPENTALDDPKRLAYQAMMDNETLARNAVVIALRRALTTEQGVVQTTAYGMGIAPLKGAAGCDGTTTGSKYLKMLLPGWTFTRAETQSAKDADPSLNACMTANVTTQISTGVGVKIGDLFVKAPIPHALMEGELERPASLRLAQKLITRLASERSDLKARSWIDAYPDPNEMLFVRQLLSSQCLNGGC